MKIVIDTETGGLDPNEHSLLTTGFVHYPSLEAFGLEVSKPVYRVTAEALQINKINLGALTGRPPVECVQELHRWLQRMAVCHEGAKGNDRIEVTPIGHNVGFDRGFLRQLYIDAGQRPMFESVWSYRALDTCAIARFLMETGRLPGLESASLKALCAYFRLDAPDHTALGDALATAHLYTALHTLLASTVTEIPEGMTQLPETAKFPPPSRVKPEQRLRPDPTGRPGGWTVDGIYVPALGEILGTTLHPDGETKVKI